MIVTVDSLSPYDSGMSIWTFTGRTENGNSVTFAVDARSGRELLAEIIEADEVECSVESWQIL